MGNQGNLQKSYFLTSWLRDQSGMSDKDVLLGAGNAMSVSVVGAVLAEVTWQVMAAECPGRCGSTTECDATPLCAKCNASHFPLLPKIKNKIERF